MITGARRSLRKHELLRLPHILPRKLRHDLGEHIRGCVEERLCTVSELAGAHFNVYNVIYGAAHLGFSKCY